MTQNADDSDFDQPSLVELVYVSPVLYLPSRDENVGLVAGSMPVHRRAGGTAVVDQDFPISPGLVLVCVFRLAYENGQCTAESQHSAILRPCNRKVETPCDYALTL